MGSVESKYIEDGYSTGFIKDYYGEKYAFAAILPNENVSVYDYMNNVDPYSFLHMLKNPVNVDVIASMPKFKYDYTLNLNDILKNAGMVDAFSSAADFLNLSTLEGIYLSRAIHKTHITVDKKSTKAGAVTALEINCGAQMGPTPEQKEVILDKPFVFTIFDTETCLPIFIGIVKKI